MSLKQVTALISGGASGLGAATASYLVKNGARVVVADLNRDAFLRMEGASSSNNHDSPLKFAKVDVMKESEITAALDLAEDEFGEEINVAINCAGIAPARKTLSLKKSEDGEVSYRMHSLTEFINAINVNTIGSFNVARLAANRMARRTKDDDGLRGCIINTASVAAYDGQVGQVAYSASKGAIVGMTLPMARDLAPLGIRVMTVAPGLFMTPLLAGLPEKVSKDLIKNVPCPARFGDPNEYAKLVGSILQNPYLNGEVIRLDGALRMPP